MVQVTCTKKKKECFMKKLLVLVLAIFAVTPVFSYENVDVACTHEDYKIYISRNVNENPINPLAVITVYKEDKIVYENYFKISYRSAGSTSSWIYSGFRHQNGVVSLVEKTSGVGSALILIYLGDGNFVNGKNISCEIE